MHVRSTPVTPADYTDKLNTLTDNGQIGPGGLGARAWPVEAHVFPGQGINGILKVNDNPGVTGQSYMYTVENQFIEVTNKWDSNGTYFYVHTIPLGVSQVTLLNEKKEIVREPYLIEGSRLYHSLAGICWVKYFADDQAHEELLTSMLVMPRARRGGQTGEAPFASANITPFRNGAFQATFQSSFGFRPR